MKKFWFCLILGGFFLSSVSLGRAEEIPLEQWSGAVGLSVATDGESGPCATTPSYGHGTSNPVCTPLTISGTTTPSNGSAYTVTGGIGPFAWSAPGATITPSGERTATVNVDGTCGSGTITVSDACGSATKEVRFPSGQWVEVEHNIFGYESATFYVMTFYEGNLKIRIVGTHRCWYLWLDGQGGCPYGDQPMIGESPLLYPRHPNYGDYCEGTPSCNGGTSWGFGTGIQLYWASSERVYEWQCP